MGPKRLTKADVGYLDPVMNFNEMWKIQNLHDWTGDKTKSTLKDSKSYLQNCAKPLGKCKSVKTVYWSMTI